MNSALTYALYLIVCKELGTETPMPTNQNYWEGYDDVSDSRLIANLTLFASSHSNCANQAFNITNGDYFSWRYMLPRLGPYFGANATSTQKFSKPRPEEGYVQYITLLLWHLILAPSCSLPINSLLSPSPSQILLEDNILTPRS